VLPNGLLSDRAVDYDGAVFCQCLF
jgi:hypothetical protein